ncbi:MAG: ABC transporter substrate-binding protein [Candidatus Saccharimonadales bacterium]
MARSGGSWNRFEYGRIQKKIASTARGASAATSRHTREFLVERWASARDVRRHIGIWLVCVGVLIAAVITQSIIVRGVYSEQAPIGGGTYAEGVYGKIDTLNPLFASTQAEHSASRLLFSSLFNHDDTGALGADLATGYKVSNEGRTYTVTLRSDALWHDGKPVTVDDVLYTIELIKDPATGSPLAASWNDVEVQKVDNEKIAFHLPAAYAPFPYALTFAILPSHILKGVSPSLLREHPFSHEPTGSGPFKVRFMQRVQGEDLHSVLHLRRNEAYYGGSVKLERMQLHVYGDREKLATGLRTQAINAASGVALDSLQEFSDNERFDVHSMPVRAGVYALMNTASPVLKDHAVRKALQVGTDVNKVLASLPDDAQQLDGPFMKDQVQTDVKKPAYNLEKAKKLLADDGWAVGGEGIRYKGGDPLEIRLVYLKNTDYENVVGGLVQQWRELGVKVTTQPVDPADPSQNLVSSVLRPRNFDVLVHELTIGADPDVYAYWHSSQASARGLNFTNFKDDISDDALSSGRSIRDDSLRQAKYESFLKRWYSQAPAIGLYQSTVPYVTATGVHSVQDAGQFVNEADRYRNVVDWTVRNGQVYKTP